MQSKVKKFIGNSIEETDMHELETTLQLEELFNEIKIETEQTSETEASINVQVKEKITFVPIPFALYTTSGLTMGAAVMDTNAFGQKDMFMVGAFYAPTAKTALALFSKSPKDNWIPGFSIFTYISDSTPKYHNLADELVLRHKDFLYMLNFTLTEKINEHFSFSNTYSFSFHNTDAYSGFEGLEPEPLKSGNTAFSFEYSDSDWNGIFMSKNSASVSAGIGLTNLSDSDYRYPMGFSFSVSEQHPIFSERLRMYQKYSGYYGIKNHWTAFQSQKEASVTLLSSHFSSERLIGGNMGLEFAVKKIDWAMISVFGDYQFIITQDFNPVSPCDDYKFIHGPNGGARFYLAKIAFPAIALGLSYNVPEKYWNFTAAMGMTF